MTKAKITKPYRCAPRGAVIEEIAVGTVVTGQVAEWAIADGAAQRMFDPRTETKVESAPETKAKTATKAKPRGRKKKADT